MGRCWSLKFSPGTIAFFFTICFLLVFISENGRAISAVETPRRRRMTTTAMVPDHTGVRGRGLLGNKHKMPQVFYANKRRVPNGADPIHNRRASKAERPAGRA